MASGGPSSPLTSLGYLASRHKTPGRLVLNARGSPCEGVTQDKLTTQNYSTITALGHSMQPQLQPSDSAYRRGAHEISASSAPCRMHPLPGLDVQDRGEGRGTGGWGVAGGVHLPKNGPTNPL